MVNTAKSKVGEPAILVLDKVQYVSSIGAKPFIHTWNRFGAIAA